MANQQSRPLSREALALLLRIVRDAIEELLGGTSYDEDDSLEETFYELFADTSQHGNHFRDGYEYLDDGVVVAELCALIGEEIFYLEDEGENIGEGADYVLRVQFGVARRLLNLLPNNTSELSRWEEAWAGRMTDYEA